MLTPNKKKTFNTADVAKVHVDDERPAAQSEDKGYIDGPYDRLLSKTINNQ